MSREVAANGGREGYRAWRAHERAREQARRPKPPKLACPRLAAQVTAWLEELWSPEEIARRLRMEFPDDPKMWVSHETIYQSLFVQGRGELRRELARCLRTGEPARVPGPRRDHGPHPRHGHDQRPPAEAADRAVPGHWEGDLIVGKASKSAVGTLVERTTRYVLLLHLPDGKDARAVDEAMRQAIATLPDSCSAASPGTRARRCPATPRSPSTPASPSTSVTPTAPGSGHRTRTPTGCSASTCPKAPTSRVHSADDLARIARSLNNRPRKTLGYMKPSEKLAELLAHTD